MSRRPHPLPPASETRPGRRHFHPRQQPPPRPQPLSRYAPLSPVTSFVTIIPGFDYDSPPRLSRPRVPETGPNSHLFNPVYDNGPNGYGHDRLGTRWREASPAHNLHARVPPTLVMVGDKDRLIPEKTVRRVSADLDKLDVPNRLVVYPDATHGFFNPGRAEGRFFDLTLAETDRFLVEQGWLPPAGK